MLRLLEEKVCLQVLRGATKMDLDDVETGSELFHAT